MIRNVLYLQGRNESVGAGCEAKVSVRMTDAALIQGFLQKLQLSTEAKTQQAQEYQVIE